MTLVKKRYNLQINGHWYICFKTVFWLYCPPDTFMSCMLFLCSVMFVVLSFYTELLFCVCRVRLYWFCLICRYHNENIVVSVKLLVLHCRTVFCPCDVHLFNCWCYSRECLQWCYWTTLLPQHLSLHHSLVLAVPTLLADVIICIVVVVSVDGVSWVHMYYWFTYL